ncbi:sugar kinase [Marinilactibacillus sp. XAAS-LB27]|uniref:sugar kinase n=1 Tax=Marinilactibacillus sp. XAAS-LB27 TaxID=3114538 RepID=UPI002E17C129|nr:sugar kinase [Marinilactibacillus sp. XAAS-LB27]
MKIVAFGEVMMRLTPPEYKLLEQSSQLDMSFTGTGLNILSGLSHFGYYTSLLTKLPDNHIGKVAAGQIRKLGVQDVHIQYGDQHMGAYFLEMGYGVRPSEVTYMDRINSAFGKSTLSDYDIEKIVDEYDIIHICGITLSLSKSVKEVAIRLAQVGKEKGKMICFDFNYRPSLNKALDKEEIKEAYKKILPYCSIVIGGERDLVELLDYPVDLFQNLALQFVKDFNLDYFAGTKRGNNDQGQTIAGFMAHKENYVMTREHSLNVYDRIGTGDAFVTGLLTGIIERWSNEKLIDFAIASSVLAHTMFGDSFIIDKSMVDSYLEGNRMNVIR